MRETLNLGRERTDGPPDVPDRLPDQTPENANIQMEVDADPGERQGGEVEGVPSGVPVAEVDSNSMSMDCLLPAVKGARATSGDSGQVTIAEICSPPRITAKGTERGLSGTWSLDPDVECPFTKRKWDLKDDK